MFLLVYLRDKLSFLLKIWIIHFFWTFTLVNIYKLLTDIKNYQYVRNIYWIPLFSAKVINLFLSISSSEWTSFAHWKAAIYHNQLLSFPLRVLGKHFIRNSLIFTLSLSADYFLLAFVLSAHLQFKIETFLCLKMNR